MPNASCKTLCVADMRCSLICIEVTVVKKAANIMRRLLDLQEQRRFYTGLDALIATKIPQHCTQFALFNNN